MQAHATTSQDHVSRGPEDTWAIAGRLLAQLPRRAVVALHGQLGAGKTCFVQGLALAMGLDRVITSPTFTIINEYPGSPPLYHVDLYRLSGPDDVLALGLEEYLESDGVTAIEWPERAGELLPSWTVHVRLEALELETERRIRIEFP